MEGQAPAEMQSLLCCKILARKPGWKDSNFQVMNAKFMVVSVLAEKAKVFGKKSVACVMPALVEKLGDIKVGMRLSPLYLLLFPLPFSLISPFPSSLVLSPDLLFLSPLISYSSPLLSPRSRSPVGRP